jgi:hypothetical protein
MNLKFFFLLFSSIYILASCESNNSEINFEKSVLKEIFPKLIDSFQLGVGIVPPPPPIPIFDENDSVIGVDNAGQVEMWKKYKIKKAELEADTTKKVLAVYDTIYEIDGRVNYQLQRHFESFNLKIDSVYKEAYRINLFQINSYKNLKYKYRSEFPEGTLIWRENYDFPFVGIVRFSRISFDKSKKFGIMEGSFLCGLKCGFTGTIFIRLENNVWLIDDIIVTSIS